jgi:methionyl-tRNA formyltransferase
VLINGESESGVTTFFLKQEIDTGDILFTEKVTLTGHETAGELHDRLMHKGAGLLVKTVKGVESGRYNEHPQSQLIAGVELKHAPKIFKEDCLVDWNQPAIAIYNKIRGLSPIPTAYTMLNGKILKIFRAEYETEAHDIQSGHFITDNKTYLKFAAKDGFISLTEVQLEGKKQLDIETFLRGLKL